jgi:very-short-patch-repair endonuclease
VAGHKLDMPERHVVAVRGLRVASAEMAWCQLSSGLSVSELVVAGDRLLRNGDSLTTRERVRLTLEEYAGRRGRARLVTAFGLLDGGSESPGETRLRVILVDAGIRGFVLNHIVTTPDGRRFRVDFAFPELKVAIEYQGGYHADDAQWRADMTRIARLEAMGWRVIQVNNDDLRDTRELVLRIRSTLTRRTT